MPAVRASFAYAFKETITTQRLMDRKASLACGIQHAMAISRIRRRLRRFRPSQRLLVERTV